MEEEDDTPPETSANLAGYPSIDDLVRGYRSSSAEGKRQRERADQLAATNEALISALSQARTVEESPRQRVPERRLIPEDELDTLGIPTDALDRFVQKRFDAQFEPIRRGLQARQEFAVKHPHYTQFENDVASFISTDPDLSQRYPVMFQADPLGAMEYAFLKFGETRRASMPPARVIDEGMTDASIPSSRSGDSRRAPDQDSAIQSAFERWQKTGSSVDAQRFVKARLKTVITDDFLNQ